MSQSRASLVPIASSILLMAGMVTLALAWRHGSALDRIEQQGQTLAGLLLQIPAAELLPDVERGSALDALRPGSAQARDLAYAVIEDPSGLRLFERAADGTLVPIAPLPREPQTFEPGRRRLDAPGRHGSYVEYYLPLGSAGHLAGHVRLGFSHPGWVPAGSELGWLTLAALLGLMPGLLHQRFARRVRSSLEAGSRQLRQHLPEDMRVDEHPSDVDGFLHELRSFAEKAEASWEQRRSERLELIASTRVADFERARLETVLKNLPEATLILDDEGRPTFANAKIEPLLGVRPEDIIGSDPERWCACPELRTFLDELSTGRRQSPRLEFAPDPASGRQLVASATRVGAQDRDASAGSVVLIRDVTREAVQRSSQLEFISQVSHELKSPMNVLAMYSETLLDRENQSEEVVRDACNVIYDEVNRLSRLISTLLTVARIESGAVSPSRNRIDLGEFLRDVLDTMSRAANTSDLGLHLRVDSEMPPFYGDKDLLRVALNNLLNNAIKYNQPGGDVTLSAEQLGDQIALRVKDTGIGIDDEEQAHVFDKFFRSESPDAQKQQGHGLGLALVQEIARIHGGQVELMSEVGQGSTFSLVFDARLMLEGGHAA